MTGMCSTVMRVYINPKGSRFNREPLTNSLVVAQIVTTTLRSGAVTLIPDLSV